MGARLPTGVENVLATYRSGIGPAGNVPADRLQLLLSRPLGVRGVTNPVAASGGTAPEALDEARANAPLTVLTLDRIVSLRDYEDFARAFAGIGKAQAVRLWNGHAYLVHITVAGAAGSPVEDNPVLLDNLRQAIDAASDPVQQVQVEGFVERRFGVAATVLLDPRLIAEDVLAAAATALTDAFSFERRGFGQPVTAADVITTLQGVTGVQAVDLNALAFVPGGGPATPPAPTGETPPSYLVAAPARVERGQVLKAELLVIEPGAVAVTAMRQTS
jgi:predicted phage baseplate assembly protein